MRVVTNKYGTYRVLVLGGAGFIGRHVIRELSNSKYDVKSLDLIKPDDAEADVEWHIGSFTDEALVSALAEGCNAVICLATTSLPASANYDVCQEITAHVGPTIRVAELCRNVGVSQFVFSSSGGTVYGTDAERPLSEMDVTLPRSAYGASKLAIEHYLGVISRFSELRTICLRIANPYGEGQRADRGQGFVAAALAAALNGTPLHVWGDGSVTRDFVHVSDVAKAFKAACAYAGDAQVFNIGSSVETSLLEIVHLVEAAAHAQVPVVQLPSRAVDVKRNVLDIARARSELAWTPEISLPDGIRRTWDWYRRLA